MRSEKKISGGRYKKYRKKKKLELPRQPRNPKLGKRKIKKIRTRGGNSKTVLLSEEKVNLINQKTGKAKITKIEDVLRTPSNKFLARQNILRKGAIIKTKLGEAKITNRPGQEGSVQAILLKE